MPEAQLTRSVVFRVVPCVTHGGACRWFAVVAPCCCTWNYSSIVAAAVTCCNGQCESAAAVFFYICELKMLSLGERNFVDLFRCKMLVPLAANKKLDILVCLRFSQRCFMA